jgi:hypothetical protein
VNKYDIESIVQIRIFVYSIELIIIYKSKPQRYRITSQTRDIKFRYNSNTGTNIFFSPFIVEMK